MGGFDQVWWQGVGMTQDLDQSVVFIVGFVFLVLCFPFFMAWFERSLTNDRSRSTDAAATRVSRSVMRRLSGRPKP